jgi:hypothetical protein
MFIWTIFREPTLVLAKVTLFQVLPFKCSVKRFSLLWFRLCVCKKDPVPFVQEAAWVLGPVWKVAENLAPTGIQPSSQRVAVLTRISSPSPPYIVRPKYISRLSITMTFPKTSICLMSSPRLFELQSHNVPPRFP